MTTHMPFDPYLNEEAVAEVREHWDGPFHFGAPDGIVVYVTRAQIWVREGILPDYPNSRAPQFDFSNGQLVVPHPTTSRAEIQEPFVREQQIDPAKYYPKGYHPVVGRRRVGHVGDNFVLLASPDLVTVVIASVSEHGECLNLKFSFGFARHPGERATITAGVGDFMDNDQMVLGIHRGLYVIADDPLAAALHGSGIRVC
jgi:hypothetical protein